MIITVVQVVVFIAAFAVIGLLIRGLVKANSRRGSK
ncbi:hypothetical protein SK3146_02010 [Paenibacillus konkukensis]|uniref:Uncharacterized protein n=1 Tax=Paenibacillus konkukensis TaxID=2020716 RepID=A0ABY4RLE8_9BACL|nr:hypothetical protein SK3146_02010 [Paenibacillus konkukensis]